MWKKIFILSCFNVCLFAQNIKVSSYNLGGLPGHYDYLRACVMEEIMEERYAKDSRHIACNQEMQELALKKIFGKNVQEKEAAAQKWLQGDYANWSGFITAAPKGKSITINTFWYERVNSAISLYNDPHPQIFNKEIEQRLDAYLANFLKDSEEEEKQVLLSRARENLAKSIFSQHVNQDILCLQEADDLRCFSFLLEEYKVVFQTSTRSCNAIAWNEKRFVLLDATKNIADKGLAVLLQDKITGKTVCVASAHLTGCNPYAVEIDSVTQKNDADKGNLELEEIVGVLDSYPADYKIIGMDSNVTALHPRLNILQKHNYNLDTENYLYPTCSSPYQVLDTRIDWIACKGKDVFSIENLPIEGVLLNSMRTNISDHRPIAAKIEMFAP